jgi:hypothetical protein
VTPDLKRKLDESAQRSGRSQSQEAELRIEQSFRDERQAQHFSDLYFGRELAALLEVIGRAMQDAGAHAAAQSAGQRGGSANWLENPYGFGTATRAAMKVLDALRPPGPVETPPDRTKAESRLGDAIASGLLSDIAHEHVEDDFMEEWARGLRGRLGRLRERLKGFDYDIAARSAALPSAHAPGVLVYDSDDPAKLPKTEGDQYG